VLKTADGRCLTTDDRRPTTDDRRPTTDDRQSVRAQATPVKHILSSVVGRRSSVVREAQRNARHSGARPTLRSRRLDNANRSDMLAAFEKVNSSLVCVVTDAHSSRAVEGTAL
jgi:hypothetical protein